jgi:hypothetical protein
VEPQVYRLNQAVVIVFPNAGGFSNGVSAVEESEWRYSGERATIRRIYGSDPTYYDVTLNGTARVIEGLTDDNLRPYGERS